MTSSDLVSDGTCGPAPTTTVWACPEGHATVLMPKVAAPVTVPFTINAGAMPVASSFTVGG